MQRPSLFATLLALSVATLSSCKKEPEVAPTPTSLTARAGADQAVLPEQAVALDGSASTGSGTLAYQWAVVRKPQRSTLTLGGASTPKATFTPDIVGEYELELTVSSGATKSQDRVVVRAEQTGPLTLSSEVKTQTRLKDRLIDPSQPDYIVSRDLAISAELSIDPGVTVAFERNTAINLKYEGTLIAEGTADSPIRFTGVKPERGFWAGIANYSPSTANKLAFVQIQYAGSRGLLSSTKAGLSLFGPNKALMALANCQLNDTDGYGLYVQEGSVLRSFARNSFRNNTEAGVIIDAYNAALLDAASTFTGGNTRNVVEVLASAIRGTADLTWVALADKTPYRLLGNLAVEAGWILKPGVTVEPARDAIINVNRDGYISAKGTPDQRITFTGSATGSGHWKGIMIYSVSNLNTLEQVDISGAGSSVMASGKRAAVGVFGAGAKLTIKNCRITNSGGYGIAHTPNAELNSDAGTLNTFSGNAQGNVAQF
ncbi:right-handed parallel beta-helix repeat-containing protein [Rudanella lutea]|uniref:right-handed parallel beta-helix repeat-containing protein n=1 Tax=Rudanella lutea TaxID=451374 RepID=UPI000376D29B|nr:right-handed parallel beta-helix repeat-containing protein [Rudanella lutea]